MSKLNTGVPDALDPTTAPGNRNYTSEHLEYVYGWNDCRQAMLTKLAEQPAPVQQEPWAWLFQHEETGLTQCVDTQQVEWGFEKNNPRWQKIAPIGAKQLNADYRALVRARDEILALREALAEQPAPVQDPVAWPIETNNQVEALAKQCGWDNRRYMTPADYQIWCDRMRQFVQLASPQAQPAREPLTLDQIGSIIEACEKNVKGEFLVEFARAIESKVKENK